MAERYHAAAIGASYVDTNTRMRAEDYHAMKSGMEIAHLGKQKEWGGSGPMFSQAFAALGRKVLFAGEVGHDFDGEFVLRQAEKAGVACFVSMKGGSITNTNENIVLDNGEKYYFTDGTANANRQLDAEDILSRLDPYKFSIERYYLAGGLKLPVFTRDLSKQLLTRKADVVIDHGRIIPGVTTEENKQTIRDVVKESKVYLPDESELMGLYDVEDLEEAMQKVKDSTDALVVVKRGKNGACYLDHGRLVEVPGYSVPVVNNVGAGDTFNAGLISSLISRKPLYDAVRFANAVAAMRVATGEFHSTQEVEEFMKTA